MARNRSISKEAREYVISQLHDHGQMTKSELVDMIRPYCSFDPITLQEQAVGRIASSIIRSVRDSAGTRTAFFVRNQDSVIDVDTCKSLHKVSSVEHQLAKQLNGITASYRKAKRRRQELSGQMDIFDMAIENDVNKDAS